jgi:hypothetical protein
MSGQPSERNHRLPMSSAHLGIKHFPSSAGA